MKIASRFALVGLSFAMPLVAVAQINVTQVQGYSNSIIYIINGILVPLLMALAFIVFLYGVYEYFILGAASDTERAKGKQFVMWGIIGFVVIFSVWSLVRIVGSTFGLQLGEGSPSAPTFNASSGSSRGTVAPAPITGGGTVFSI